MRRLLCLLALLLAAAGPARAQTLDFAAVTAEIAASGDAAIAGYEPSTGLETADAFSDIYFDVFEASGMEAAIGAADAGLKTSLEAGFGKVIGLATQGAPAEQVTAAWTALRADLEETARARADAGTGALAVLVQAFLILLREGFEAILVVGALIAYLRRLGAVDGIRVVWRGVWLALAASLVTAYAMVAVFRISGPDREALEGATMLLAAAVLTYVSHWLFARREAARWQSYIKEQVEQAVSSGQAFSLGFAAFLAVYREGAETVLFYQALLAGAPGQEMPAAAGFAAAAVALGAIYWLMRTASLRLPLGLFFGATAVLLYGLAFTFAGQGILELQEARWVAMTPLAGVPTIPWLGVFPTAESLAAQAVLLALLLPVALGILRRRAAARATTP